MQTKLPARSGQWVAPIRANAIPMGFLAVLSLALVAWAGPPHLQGRANGTIAPVPPELANPEMECSAGLVEGTNSEGESIFLPQSWELALETGAPEIHSARVFFEQRADPSGGCTTDRAHVERIEGRDSMVVRARDLETPPEPGKPFDVVIAQRVAVVPGFDYSASGWMLSLCGGSAVPSDCPEAAYIVKALGLDPAGGSDPMAPEVLWTEDTRNFVDENNERVGWANLRVAAKAQAQHMTVYARLHSPVRHHGNHGFIDALSFVRAPVAWLWTLPEEVRNRRDLRLSWASVLSPDIDQIPGGTFEYLVDVQVREKPDGEWTDLATGLPEHQKALLYCAPRENGSYEFRVRARAEQPPAPPEGAWPNQRYPGVWSAPQSVRFVEDPNSGTGIPGPFRLFVPALGFDDPCR